MGKVTIAGARVSCGYTQKELAEKMGVARETVQAWESNKRAIRTPYIKLFCNITGFTEDELFLPQKTTLSVNEGEQA